MGSPSGETARIAVDVMGGDHGPAEVVAAVKLALEEFPQINPVTLVGDQAVLTPLLRHAGLGAHASVAVLHASEVITMDDKPLQALKRKKDASMVRALELVKDGAAAAVVSCGNTGALMAGGTLKLRTMEGIDRPALAALVPRENGCFILIDGGANPESTAEHLMHNAILGAHYCRIVLGVPAPRVGLLTIGTEEGKGTALVSEAHEQLKRLGEAGLLDYAGPIEGFQVFAEHVDVVVCDGFVGNICLKTWESLVRFFSATLKTELSSNPLRAAGALLARGAFTELKHRVNPDRYGGAPLLGLRGHVLKTHGSSNRHAWKSALCAASEIIKNDLNRRIEADVARAHELLRQPVG